MPRPNGFSRTGSRLLSPVYIQNAYEPGTLDVGNASRWMNTRLTGFPSTSFKGIGIVKLPEARNVYTYAATCESNS